MEELSVLALAHERAARLSRILTVIGYGLIVTALPFVVYVLVERGASKQVVAWVVAGVCVMLAVSLSIHDINANLDNFERPELQKYVVRILFMIPIYSITSWLALYDEKLNVLLDSIRGLYEAFVIWSFTYFLMVYLGPTQEMLAERLSLKPQEEHLFPFNYILRPWQMGYEFLFKCKFGTLQYVIWKILNELMVLIATALGVYGYGTWSLTAVYFYCMMITNFSQLLAIYCLALFYHATYKDLAPIHPLAKFICIKAVIFFSFWQETFLSMLVFFGWIKSTPYFSASEYAEALQDFIICIEMFIFSIAHHYYFSYRDFEGNAGDSPSSTGSGRAPYGRALLESAFPNDLVYDITRDMRRLSRGGSFSASTYENTASPGPSLAGRSGQLFNESNHERYLVEDQEQLSRLMDQAKAQAHPGNVL
uniref:Transmembrane protein 184C n=1 Tax=Mucochytrium quahogii TaxID=96639 RepID=A0A7S2W9S9_9STRA|mmetsp:Transcript_6864/g.10852  ORF Transcript_6864/g.10852 Transcript_6864/m.10852 type:complete len:423 (-) Transcript_6864:1808-3076(-)|eukprot:CAMPEP_0203762086 /NCGR_PEP_ID=MMETSP0098-20131031/15048_1 /ASSEMBLY_ACC=CAM_ASM_000208 /TAXON_ID=96639 /ORGANISM=" , Strain NY0313808BC1" /LENGTH=422 /DNA_ID=CAMNT_0050656355 /DNA_START=164 /DNA_END=1432 /DNA_ORIENTATION=-